MTEDELRALDELIERSVANAGPYLRSSFDLPEHSLDARGLAALFSERQTGALATVTARGEPRAAPVAVFLHGASFCLPTVRTAARCRHIRRNPSTSLTCFAHEWAVLAHGSSAIVEPGGEAFAALERRAAEVGLGSVLDWGEGVYVRLDPATLIAWTREAPGEAAG